MLSPSQTALYFAAHKHPKYFGNSEQLLNGSSCFLLCFAKTVSSSWFGCTLTSLYLFSPFLSVLSSISNFQIWTDWTGLKMESEQDRIYKRLCRTWFPSELRHFLTPEEQELCEKTVRTAAEVVHQSSTKKEDVRSGQAFLDLQRILEELKLHAGSLEDSGTTSTPCTTADKNQSASETTPDNTEGSSVNHQRSSIHNTTEIDAPPVKKMKTAHTNYEKIAAVMARYSFDSTPISANSVAGRQLNVEVIYLVLILEQRLILVLGNSGTYFPRADEEFGRRWAERRIKRQRGRVL